MRSARAVVLEYGDAGEHPKHESSPITSEPSATVKRDIRQAFCNPCIDECGRTCALERAKGSCGPLDGFHATAGHVVVTFEAFQVSKAELQQELQAGEWYVLSLIACPHF